MTTDIVKQYYKDPDTGTEMSFSKHSDYGWCISFPFLDAIEALDYAGDIPWPKLSTEEQAVVDANYENLRKMLREEGECGK